MAFAIFVGIHDGTILTVARNALSIPFIPDDNIAHNIASSLLSFLVIRLTNGGIYTDFYIDEDQGNL